jgi:predicted O-linked N-acetylglucosamine transferase (SPINDLY family)
MLEAAQLVHAGAQSLNQGDAGKALEKWAEAERIFPACGATWAFLNDLKSRAGLLLGKVGIEQEAWEAVIATATRVLEGDAGNLEALDQRRYAWYRLGCLAEHLADTKRSLEIAPDVEKHNGLLFKLNFLPETTPESLFEEARRWDELYAQPLAAAILPHTNTRDGNRRLKIGYVSPDLYHHPIMKFLPPVFELHDRAEFEIFVYDLGTKKDSFTQYVKRTVEHFVELPLDKEAIAGRVRADGIDILIDLAGQSMAAEGLLAFALKPAPVQATWLGCMATTGMAAMDYFIGDANMPCPGTDHLFSEKVFRLPRVQSAYRPVGEHGIAAPPCLANGYLTFGCFNSKAKITRAMVQAWSLILHLHAGSKLLLKSWGLENEGARKELKGWFREDAIEVDRILFEGHSLPSEYLAAWNKVDIALDPFPYNGGSTTLDALWMGVPVVSLTGRLAVSCAGVSLMPPLGLPVARTFEEYVSIAVLLGKRVPVAAQSRGQLRRAMQASALMDEVGLVRALEGGYREMWRASCSGG